MKKKIAALLCGVLLLAQLAAPPAKAADYVFFIAANENILPLSDKTMPFWQDDYLYIPSSIFKDNVLKSLGIGVVQNKTKKLTVLHEVGVDWPLCFDWGKGTVYDPGGNYYGPGAVYKNGEVYVPAYVVAQFFDLQYSVTAVNTTVGGQTIRGSLAWLRQADFGDLPDRVFVDAAAHSIADCYNTYLKSKEPVTVTPPTPSTPTIPAIPTTPVVTPDLPQTGVEIEGKKIYLCMEAGSRTAELLNALDRYGVQGTFFCSPEFMAENGGLLRRMTATGHAIGIMVDGSREDLPVMEQLETANEALRLATCGKTRLVRLRNVGQQQRRLVEEAGYRWLDATVNRVGYVLRSASNAESLLTKVSEQPGDVSVWLAETANGIGLRSFLEQAEQADGRCLAWSETA